MRRRIPENATIVRLPDGRLVLVDNEFRRAANDRYRQPQARFSPASVELWKHTIQNEGKVDFFTAKQFLEGYGSNTLFKNNRHINDERAQKPLKDLGFETVINLYEAITQRPMQDNSMYLDLLNQSIDLSEEELIEWTRPIEKFYAKENIPFLEQKWEDAKRNGLIAKSEDSFAQTMAESFENPQLISNGGYLRRVSILQFISDAYSDFTGEQRVQIQLLQAQNPNLGGFHTVDENTGQHVIGINVNNFAFQSNFQSIMNVLNHERYHASDQMLAEKYRNGEIKKGDNIYKRARIAAAGMSPNGYISGHAMAGQLAYREQIVEVGAHHAGKLAEYYTHETFAKEPTPVITLRGDTERHLLGKEYEDMHAQRQARIRYPQGLSPFRGMEATPTFG